MTLNEISVAQMFNCEINETVFIEIEFWISHIENYVIDNGLSCVFKF